MPTYRVMVKSVLGYTIEYANTLTEFHANAIALEAEMLGFTNVYVVRT